MGFRTMAFLMSSDRPDLVFQDLCSFKVQASWQKICVCVSIYKYKYT